MTPVVTLLPVAALEPLHDPLAVHDDGLLVTDQVSADAVPVFMFVGLAEIVTTGTATAVTVALAGTLLPITFVHVSVYIVVPAVAIVPVFADPATDCPPLHDPLAVHEVGLFVADHEIVELPPVPMLVGLAEIVTTGEADGPPPPATLATTAVLAEPVPPEFVHDKL
jgi:hypothetical protein